MTQDSALTLSSEQEAALMDAFRNTQDATAKEALVSACMPLIDQYTQAFAKRDPSRRDTLSEIATKAAENAVEGCLRNKSLSFAWAAPYYIKAALLRDAMDCTISQRLA